MVRQTRIFNVSIPSVSSIESSSGALNNLKYTINWDSIFQGENLRYQTARLRIDLISDNVASSTNIGNTTGLLILQGINSYGGSCINTSVSAPSPYNNGGAYTAHIYPTASSATGAASGNYYYYISSLNATYGTEIVMPKGVQDIRVLWLNENTIDLITDTYLSNYNLILQIELTDPISAIPV